jgi:hypothetical protein
MTITFRDPIDDLEIEEETVIVDPSVPIIIFVRSKDHAELWIEEIKEAISKYKSGTSLEFRK